MDRVSSRSLIGGQLEGGGSRVGVGMKRENIGRSTGCSGWSARRHPESEANVKYPDLLVSEAGVRQSPAMVRSPRFPVVGASVLGSALLLLQNSCERLEKPAPGAPSSAAQPSAQASAVPTSFDEVTAQLDHGGSLYFYLSTQQLLAGLSEQLASFESLVLAADSNQTPEQQAQAKKGFDFLVDLLKNGGIEQMSGMGASSIAIEPDVYRNKLFFHHPRGQGNGFLWSIFGKTAHPLDGLDLLPSKTAMAFSFDLDLPQILGIVRQEINRLGSPEEKQGFEEGLAQASTTLGMPLDQFLNSLGGSIGLVLTLDPSKPVTLPPPQSASIPTPQLALFLPVKDDRIFQQIDKSLSANPQVARVEEPDLHMRSMPPMPALPGLALKMTVAQSKGMLIIASDDQMVRDMLAARAGKGGFKSTPEFAKLAAGLPTQGNGFQLSTKAFSEALLQFQREAMKNQPTIPPQQLAVIEKLFGGATPSDSYSVSSAIDNGWLAVGKSKSSVSMVAGPALVVPAMMAAIAVPAFTRAQERAKEVQQQRQQSAPSQQQH